LLKKVRFMFITGFLILSVFTACEKETADPDAEDTDTNTNTDYSGDFVSTLADALANNFTDHENAADYTWDESDETEIVLNGTSITVNGEGASVKGSIVTITGGGNYNISGLLNDGQIIVEANDDLVVRLILNGINITCSKSAPIFIDDAEKTVIVLPENTENFITDGTSYTFASADEDEPNAALFSKDALTIFGTGSLTINANYNDGIASKDGLIIASGILNISALDDGIRGKDYLIIKGGEITLTAGGDGLNSDNEDDLAKGYIYIENGAINISSAGDAISGQTDVLISGGQVNLTSGGGSSNSVAETCSAKGLKGTVNIIAEGGTININAADDAVHSEGNIVINGGELSLSTSDDGIHSEGLITINGDEVYITKSYEGIEGPSITVNNGIVSIVSSDDGFNASKGNGGENDDGSYLYLKGGSIFVNTPGNDGLDSNGSIVISGGTVVVHGPQSQPEVGMDYNGTCNISGGFLIMSGTNSNMTQGPSTTSTQYSLKLILTSSISAGSFFHIQDDGGNDIVTFKPLRSCYSIVFSSPDLQKGSTYYIYTGGSSTGTETNGLYKGGAYTPGTLYTSFTVSSILTSIGTASGGGPGGGPGRP